MFRFLERLSRLVLRHPGAITLVIAAITALALLQVRHLGFEFSSEILFLADAPELTRYHHFTDVFGDDDDTFVIAVLGEDLFSPQMLARTSRITHALESVDGVRRVISLANIERIVGDPEGFTVGPLLAEIPETAEQAAAIRAAALGDPLIAGRIVSRDGRAEAFVLDLDSERDNYDLRAHVFSEVERIFGEEGLAYHIAGVPVVRNEYIHFMQHDTRIFFPIVFAQLVILHGIIFRNLRGILLPLMAVGLATLWTTGLMAATGHPINIITFVLPTLLLVIGGSYSIHFLLHEQEHLTAGKPRREALRETIQQIGIAILLTSATTGIGFLSLWIIPMLVIREFGSFAAIGIAFSFLLTVTAIPAVSILTARFTRAPARRYEDGLVSRLMGATATAVERHSRLILVLSALLFAASLIGCFRLRVSHHLMEDIPPQSRLYRDHQVIESRLMGLLPVEVMVESEPGSMKDPELLRKLQQVQQRAATYDFVTETTSIVDFLARMNQAVLDGDPQAPRVPASRELVAQYLLLYSFSGETDILDRYITPDGSAARIEIKARDVSSERFSELEEDLKRLCRELFPDRYTVTITGATFMANTLFNNLVENMVKSFFLATLIITLILAALFRSLKVGLVAMIPNVIPILMTMGLMGLLEIHLRTSIVVVFSISLGIAVDDTIHFLARYLRELPGIGDPDRTVRFTLQRTGRAIFFTSVVLTAGFLVLTTSEFPATINLGFLSAVTMVSALLGDLFLLPVLAKLFRLRPGRSR